MTSLGSTSLSAATVTPFVLCQNQIARTAVVLSVPATAVWLRPNRHRSDTPQTAGSGRPLPHSSRAVKIVTGNARDTHLVEQIQARVRGRIQVAQRRNCRVGVIDKQVQ